MFSNKNPTQLSFFFKNHINWKHRLCTFCKSSVSYFVTCLNLKSHNEKTDKSDKIFHGYVWFKHTLCIFKNKRITRKQKFQNVCCFLHTIFDNMFLVFVRRDGFEIKHRIVIKFEWIYILKKRFHVKTFLHNFDQIFIVQFYLNRELYFQNLYNKSLYSLVNFCSTCNYLQIIFYKEGLIFLSPTRLHDFIWIKTREKS